MHKLVNFSIIVWACFCFFIFTAGISTSFYFAFTTDYKSSLFSILLSIVIPITLAIPCLLLWGSRYFGKQTHTVLWGAPIDIEREEKNPFKKILKISAAMITIPLILISVAWYGNYKYPITPPCKTSFLKDIDAAFDAMQVKTLKLRFGQDSLAAKYKEKFLSEKRCITE